MRNWPLAAGRLALDWLLPPACPLCDAPVAQAPLLCAACFADLTLLAGPLCRCCGTLLEEWDAAMLCAACAVAPPVFAEARAALRYDAAARRLLLPFKHGGRSELACLLAIQMARAGAGLLARADLLVPVPLHRARLRQRGYNQAALLARHLGRRAGRAVALDALLRTLPTPSLGGLDAPGRAAALAGAFRVHPARQSRIAGRRVLMIDDVLTSGATANACAGVLLAAGAGGVDVLAAARVPDPRRAAARDGQDWLD
ncbi:MAG: ComF family protein [Rhodospirillales bacterium]|nr:ComF family protein [Rhodospirillales bacterium]